MGNQKTSKNYIQRNRGTWSIAVGRSRKHESLMEIRGKLPHLKTSDVTDITGLNWTEAQQVLKCKKHGGESAILNSYQYFSAQNGQIKKMPFKILHRSTVITWKFHLLRCRLVPRSPDFGGTVMPIHSCPSEPPRRQLGRTAFEAFKAPPKWMCHLQYVYLAVVQKDMMYSRVDKLKKRS